jgi:hypothetical protein
MTPYLWATQLDGVIDQFIPWGKVTNTCGKSMENAWSPGKMIY